MTAGKTVVVGLGWKSLKAFCATASDGNTRLLRARLLNRLTVEIMCLVFDIFYHVFVVCIMNGVLG